MDFTNDDGKLFVNICRTLTNRAADLLAALLVGVLEKSGSITAISDHLFIMGKASRITIAVEGEVWKKVPRFKQRVRNAIELITNRKIAEAIEMMSVYDANSRDKAVATVALAQLFD